MLCVHLSTRLVACFCLALLLSLGFLSYISVAAPVLQIRISVNRSDPSLSFLGDQVYSVGEDMTIFANVTLDGSAAANLAAVELDSPYGNPSLIRTVETGNVSLMYFRVQILDFYTCGQTGRPQTLFYPGDTAYVNITIKNIDYILHHVKLGFCSQASDKTPLYAYYPEDVDIGPQGIVEYIVPFLIAGGAPAGQARVFASLFTDYPASGGYPYCPEQAANFSIRASTPAMPLEPEYNSIAFSLPRKNMKLGNCTVYAATNFNLVQTATATKQFTVILLGDLYKDYVVNMKDIAVCIQLFQTTPNSLNWNPDVDVNKDGIVNMKDIALVIRLFQNNAIP
jgi:hypothetical protein